MKIHFVVFVVFVAWLVAAEGVSDPFIIGGNERGEESRERKSAFARRLLNAHSEQEVMIKGGLKMKRKHRDRIIATQKAFKARQSATAKKTKESFREVADKSISAANAAKTVTTREKGITTPNPQKGGADDNSGQSLGTQGERCREEKKKKTTKKTTTTTKRPLLPVARESSSHFTCAQQLQRNY